MIKLSEKVQDCLNNKSFCSAWGGGVIVRYDLLQEVYNKLSFYEALLPCEVGTTLYKVHRGELIAYTVKEVLVFIEGGDLVSCLKCCTRHCCGSVGGFVHIPSQWVGTEVFLTVKEAELYYKERGY